MFSYITAFLLILFHYGFPFYPLIYPVIQDFLFSSINLCGFSKCPNFLPLHLDSLALMTIISFGTNKEDRRDRNMMTGANQDNVINLGVTPLNGTFVNFNFTFSPCVL